MFVFFVEKDGVGKGQFVCLYILIDFFLMKTFLYMNFSINKLCLALNKQQSAQLQ